MTTGATRREESASSPRPGIDLQALCYRSVAASALSLPEILSLVESAQNRNAELGVTGVLFYAHGRFVQWLEGPESVIDALMQDISGDTRHRNVEVLTCEPLAVRRFTDWHLQLTCGEAEADLLTLGERSQVIVLDDETAGDVEGPNAAESAMVLGGFLSDACRAAEVPLHLFLPVPEDARPTFGAVALRARPTRHTIPVSLRQTAAELTDILAGSDPFARLTEIESLCRGYGPLPSDFGRLYEEVSDSVGDGLKSDHWSMTQVTLASAVLQLVLRRIHHLPDPENGRGMVTVSSAPGEPRFLEATITGEVLRGAGWSTSILYPDSDAALIARLKDTGVSTLVLAASRLDPAESDDDLIGLIAALRAEPALSDLRIIIGGHLGQRPEAEIAALGCDAGFAHILDVAEAVFRTAAPEAPQGPKGEWPPVAETARPARRAITSGFLLANVMPRVFDQMTERRLSNG